MKKIAIRISNKREFDALMKHYEGKGWASKMDYNKHHDLVEHTCDKEISKTCMSIHFFHEYDTILDFATFAQIAGIEVVNEVVVEVGTFTTIVNKNSVTFSPNIHYLPCDKLEEIYSAYKSLQE